MNKIKRSINIFFAVLIASSSIIHAAPFNYAHASSWAKSSGTLSEETATYITAGSGVIGAAAGYAVATPQAKPFVSIITGLVCTGISYLITKCFTLKTTKAQIRALYKNYFSCDAPCHKITNPMDVKTTIKKYRNAIAVADTVFPYIETEQYLIQLKQAIIDLTLLIEKVSPDTHTFELIDTKSLSTIYERINEEVDALRTTQEWQKERIQKLEEERLILENNNIRANTLRQEAERAERLARANANNAHAHALNVNTAKEVVNFFQ